MAPQFAVAFRKARRSFRAFAFIDHFSVFLAVATEGGDIVNAGSFRESGHKGSIHGDLAP